MAKIEQTERLPFAGHTPPPVDSSHPRHHNLPISIHDQALGATEHNLDGNHGSCDPHCRRSSELRPPLNSFPWGARVAAGRAGIVGRGDFAPSAARTSLSQAGPSPPRLPLPPPPVPPARASGRRARTWARRRRSRGGPLRQQGMAGSGGGQRRGSEIKRK